MEVLNSLTALAHLPARSCGEDGVRLSLDLEFFFAVTQIFRSLFPGFFWLSWSNQDRGLCLQRYNS